MKHIIALAILLAPALALADLSSHELDYSVRPLKAPAPQKALLIDGKTVWNPELHAISIDGFFERTISEDLAVIYSPLPLGLLYHLRGDGDLQTAVSWNLGFFYDYELAFAPRFDSYARKLLSPSCSLEFQIEYGAALSWPRYPLSGSLGLAFGSRFALGDRDALIPSVQVKTNAWYLTDEEAKYEEPFDVVMPVVLEYDHRFGVANHLGATYSYDGFGIGRSSYEQSARLFWQQSW